MSDTKIEVNIQKLTDSIDNGLKNVGEKIGAMNETIKVHNGRLSKVEREEIINNITLYGNDGDGGMKKDIEEIKVSVGYIKSLKTVLYVLAAIIFGGGGIGLFIINASFEQYLKNSDIIKQLSSYHNIE